MVESTVPMPATMPLCSLVANITVQPQRPTASSNSHHPLGFTAGFEDYHHGAAMTHSGTNTSIPSFTTMHDVCGSLAHLQRNPSPRAVGLHTILSS
ncbi:unnamed protein product [Prunus armeniaca]